MSFFYLENFIEITVENWYLILPFSILLFFAARFFESVTIFLVGAAIGFFYLNPFVMGWISKSGFDIPDVFENLLPYIIAILIGIAFLAIYKIAVFFLVAIASGGLVYFTLQLIIDSFPKIQESLPSETIPDNKFMEYALIIVAVVIGIIGGYIGAKKSTQFFRVFSVILGSLGIVFSGYVVTMMLNYNNWDWTILTKDLNEVVNKSTLRNELTNYISNNFNTLHAAIIIVLIVILCILKFKGRKKVVNTNNNAN